MKERLSSSTMLPQNLLNNPSSQDFKESETNISPVLSIIIAAYNEEKTINNCLMECKKINDISIEIIVIDDGCTDSTGIIVKKIQEEDSRIKYIKQKNSGVSSARNKGLDIASGQYIMFADADDKVLASSITEMMSVKDSDIIQGVQIFSGEEYSASNQVIKVPGKTLLSVCLNRNAYKTSFDNIGSNVILSVHGCYGKAFKREFLEQNNLRFIEGVGLGEDLLFYMECLKKVEYITLVDIPIYQISVNPYSTTRKFNNRMPGYAQNAIEIIEKLYRNDSDCKNSDVSNAVLDHLAVAVQAYFANKQMQDGVKNSIKEFKKWLENSRMLEDSLVISATDLLKVHGVYSIKDKLLFRLLQSRKFGLYIFIKSIHNKLK